MGCVRRSARKEGKLRRLRELARLAAELEIDRLQSENQSPTSADIHQVVQAAFQPAPEASLHQGQVMKRIKSPLHLLHPELCKRRCFGCHLEWQALPHKMMMFFAAVIAVVCAGTLCPF